MSKEDSFSKAEILWEPHAHKAIKIQGILGKTWGLLDENPEKKQNVYHYTDSLGLAAILKSRRLWLTEAKHLNDPNEVAYGVVRIKQQILKIARKKTKINEDFLSKLGEGIEKDRKFSTFIGSLSYSRNHLNQWTRYANNGQGFCIGFDLAILKKKIMSDMIKFMSYPENERAVLIGFPVRYEKDAFKEELEEIVRILEERIEASLDFHRSEENSHEEKFRFVEEIYRLYVQIVICFGCALKHASYEDEKEFRILNLIKGDKKGGFKKRTRGFKFVPYTEFSWEDHNSTPLKEIIIGPAAKEHEARNFALSCLNEFNITQTVKITKSKLPYRSSY